MDALGEQQDRLRGQVIELGTRVLVTDDASPYYQREGRLKARHDVGARVSLKLGKRIKDVTICWSGVAPFSASLLLQWEYAERIFGKLARAYAKTERVNGKEGRIGE